MCLKILVEIAVGPELREWVQRALGAFWPGSSVSLTRRCCTCRPCLSTFMPASGGKHTVCVEPPRRVRSRESVVGKHFHFYFTTVHSDHFLHLFAVPYRGTCPTCLVFDFWPWRNPLPTSRSFTQRLCLHPVGSQCTLTGLDRSINIICSCSQILS